MRRLTPEPYQEYFGIMIPMTGIKNYVYEYQLYRFWPIGVLQGALKTIYKSGTT